MLRTFIDKISQISKDLFPFFLLDCLKDRNIALAWNIAMQINSPLGLEKVYAFFFNSAQNYAKSFISRLKIMQIIVKFTSRLKASLNF